MRKLGRPSKIFLSQVWRPELAYAVGLIATDGCLGSNAYSVNLTSKDSEQIDNFSKCLGVRFKVGKKGRGSQSIRKYFLVQFKNKEFYYFLISIGLTPRKSKTLGPLEIPPKYFWDFLRGVYDGDGSSYAYWDKRWRSSFMFYTCFASASRRHLEWLQRKIHKRIRVSGHITHAQGHSTYQLKYAKSDSLALFSKMYPSKKVMCLSRKRLKIERILSTVGTKP